MDTDKIPGIGLKTSERLAEMGVKTIGELARFDLFKLIEEFGKKTATYMHNVARGIDDEPVLESEEKKQIMRIVTLKKDATASEEMYSELYDLCQSVFQKAANRKLSFKSVGILLILDNMSKSKSLKVHATSFDAIHSTAKAVLDEAMAATGRAAKVRRLGVRLSDLRSSAGQNTMLDFMGSRGR
jgi:nucleotidyltransferase/DNA polymerase involved in DNA repair